MPGVVVWTGSVLTPSLGGGSVVVTSEEIAAPSNYKRQIIGCYPGVVVLKMRTTVVFALGRSPVKHKFDQCNLPTCWNSSSRLIQVG